MLYPCKSGWNLPTSSWDIVHTSTFWLKFGSLSPAVTLQIRSRSPKPNQLFVMSQCYINADSIKIHPLVHEIWCKQESVTLTPMPTPTPTPTPTLTPTPQYVPLPFDGGHNNTIGFNKLKLLYSCIFLRSIVLRALLMNMTFKIPGAASSRSLQD